MADIIPNDPLFRSAFAEQRVSQAFLARYYLRALEQKVKGEAEPEFVPTDDENFINLEHVLPENPEGNWPGFDSSTAEAFYKRLGNLVLLQAKKNTLIGNGGFATKTKTISESAYMLTSEVAGKAKWGPDEIAERQAKLADLAVLTWPMGI